MTNFQMISKDYFLGFGAGAILTFFITKCVEISRLKLQISEEESDVESEGKYFMSSCNRRSRITVNISLTFLLGPYISLNL